LGEGYGAEKISSPRAERIKVRGRGFLGEYKIKIVIRRKNG
jgi:hypothetical protein